MVIGIFSGWGDIERVSREGVVEGTRDLSTFLEEVSYTSAGYEPPEEKKEEYAESRNMTINEYNQHLNKTFIENAGIADKTVAFIAGGASKIVGATSKGAKVAENTLGYFGGFMENLPLILVLTLVILFISRFT